MVEAVFWAHCVENNAMKQMNTRVLRLNRFFIIACLSVILNE
jgi:hypothetical protein